MLVMTAKVDKRKVFFAIGLLAAVIVLVLAVGGGGGSAAEAPPADTNDARVKFLTDLGWDITVSPVESGQVRIPKNPDEVFSRYNELQKSQGYDLSAYGGKTVTRYVYQVNNYPGAAGPVYATVLVCDGKIIGGDITDTGPGGRVQGFSQP